MMKKNNVPSESIENFNSFLMFRIILSSIVIISHVSGAVQGSVEFSIGLFSIGTVAVFGFFSISGYLVTPGLLKYGQRRYLTNRFFRIYPGYIFCIIVTSLLFLPLWLSQANRNIFSWSLALNYFLGNLVLFPQSASSPNSTWNELDGVPVNGAHPGMVNGSIWTLPLEITCYAVLAVYVLISKKFGKEENKKVVATLFVIFWIISIFLALQIPDIGEHHGSKLVQLATKWPYFLAFASGVVIRLIIKVSKTRFMLISLLIVAILTMQNLKIWAVCGSLIFSFLCIQFGESAFFRSFHRLRDISFGLYLYHFPIIQFLVGYKLFFQNFVLLLISTFIISILFAYMSSRFIEVPAQLFIGKRLKNN